MKLETSTNRGIENLPIIANETYNRYLKDVAYCLGWKMKLTTHVARKTFGMIALNDFEVPIEVVSAVLGHTNIATTQRTYAKVNEAHIKKSFRKALKKKGL